MKNYSANFLAHVRQANTTLAVCWQIRKRNGTYVRGTEHDRDILIATTNIGMDPGSPAFSLAGLYSAAAGITASDMRGSSDMSVDNMEARGAVDPDLFVDVSIADLEAGEFDGAEITTFRVNWQDPDDFQDVLRHGYSGEHWRNAEGAYRIEIRGLTQILQQSIGRTAGEKCDVKSFGDARCKFDVAAHTVEGTITAVTSRKRFSATLTLNSPAPSAGYFVLGKLTMQAGENAGYSRQVKNDAVGSVLGEIELADPFPRDLEIGETFTLAPGCDRRYETCRDVHNNLVNFRGPGYFTPGMDQIIRAP